MVLLGSENVPSVFRVEEGEDLIALDALDSVLYQKYEMTPEERQAFTVYIDTQGEMNEMRNGAL